MKLIRSFSLVTIVLSLTGCMAVTKQIQHAVDNAKAYPASVSKNTAVSNNPPIIQIDHYKSVQVTPNRPYQRSDVAVALAASGGGYRASDLVLGVLMGLEKYQDKALNGSLLEEVGYFSSVSGGGFGVGYYLSRYNHFLKLHEHDSPLPHFSLKTEIDKALEYPAQKIDGKYTGRGNVLNVNLNNVIELGGDHYKEYESTINQTILNVDDGEDFVLGDIFLPKDDPRSASMPLWVVNSSIYQNMAILPFTPDVLAKYHVRSYTHMDHKEKILGETTDPYYGTSFPYSVALAASSSVPFAMRATTLKADNCIDEGCYLQLFDGGLSDNLGVISAYDMLLQDKAPIKLLIVVDASGTAERAYSKEEYSPGIFSMIWRVMNAGIDASRLLVRNNVQKSVKAMMCENGATNVMIAYLDLDKFPEAYKVPTTLHLTKKQQKMMLDIGQKLVEQSPELQKTFRRLIEGDRSIETCPEIKHATVVSGEFLT